MNPYDENDMDDADLPPDIADPRQAMLDRRQCAKTAYMAYARERARQGRAVASYETLDELEVEAWMSAGRASAVAMMTDMLAIADDHEATDQDRAAAILIFEEGAREEYEAILRRRSEGHEG